MSNNDMFSEEYNKKWNSYFYPGEEVFVNKLNIHDKDELDKREAELSFERLVELHENPIEGDFDKDHLRLIHKYLFQDLYDWAGEYRTVYMAKNQSYFAEVDSIDKYLEYDLEELKNESNKVYGIDMFAIVIADYYISLLNIHPFREGNGRTIREFLREFTIRKTKELGFGEYDLDWSQVDSDVIDAAMPLARVIKSPIQNEIRKAIVKVEPTKSL